MLARKNTPRNVPETLGPAGSVLWHPVGEASDEPFVVYFAMIYLRASYGGIRSSSVGNNVESPARVSRGEGNKHIWIISVVGQIAPLVPLLSLPLSHGMARDTGMHLARDNSGYRSMWRHTNNCSPAVLYCCCTGPGIRPCVFFNRFVV